MLEYHVCMCVCAYNLFHIVKMRKRNHSQLASLRLTSSEEAEAELKSCQYDPRGQVLNHIVCLKSEPLPWGF